ncbi:MAG: HisA/HisF-related TIM barrel protein [Gammaproteobacteria bacterium]
MLKKRLIPLLLLDNERVWKSKQFNNCRDVGAPRTAGKVYENQHADELCILNIGENHDSFRNLVKYTRIISENCCMPLTIGGGINSFLQAQELFDNGADKVVLNSINYSDIKVLEEIANIYGSQAAVVCIDVRFDAHRNDYSLYSARGRVLEGITLREHIFKCDLHGAGEFLIQSIDRDGMMDGLDIKLGHIASKSTSTPVVLAGGVGSYAHIEAAFKELSLSGIACASIFHFTDSNPLRASAYLANAGFSIKKV